MTDTPVEQQTVEVAPAQTLNIYQRINYAGRILRENPWIKDMSNSQYKSVDIDQIRHYVGDAETEAGIVVEYIEEEFGTMEANGKVLAKIRAKLVYTNIDDPEDIIVFGRTAVAYDALDKGWNKADSMLFKNHYKALYHIGEREDDPDSMSNEEHDLLEAVRGDKNVHDAIMVIVNKHLPGIRTNLIEQHGAYAGSGIPIALYDSRIGLSGYRTRVKQVTVDYNLCTTQVTLVNYGLIHSNSLSSTAAVAISASDYATGMTDTALYDTQYVYVRTDKVQTVKKTGNVVKMKTESGVEILMTDVQILQYPHGNVLVAYGPNDKHIEDKYGLTGVSVNNGTWIEIPSSARPDFYTGQVLILNLFFPSG